MEVHRAGGVPIKIWVNNFWENVEPQAILQLERVSRLPFVKKAVCAMPDVHLGKGACVGSVIPLQGAVVPSLVGVDPGCGMIAQRICLKKGNVLLEKETLEMILPHRKELRKEIEDKIPVGHRSHHYGKNLSATLKDSPLKCFDSLPKKTKERIGLQVGTLGGGNHFIELQKDQEDGLWVMVHSGSRNVGKEVATYYIDKAKKQCKEMFIKLEDPDLAYFSAESEDYANYIHDMKWCQEYAAFNREHILKRVMEIIKKKFEDYSVLNRGFANCHHNYLDMENHNGSNYLVIRKGAVRARHSDTVIIPGSMGTKTYICKGLGNETSFNSCSHGAGRKMSRSEAKKTFNEEDILSQTKGIECRKDTGILDEIPGAYKDIETVMENQKDLVHAQYELTPILAVKG